MEKLEIYDEDTLNEIELKRQNNIIRNWEFLKLCGLPVKPMWFVERVLVPIEEQYKYVSGSNTDTDDEEWCLGPKKKKRNDTIAVSTDRRTKVTNPTEFMKKRRKEKARKKLLAEKNERIANNKAKSPSKYAAKKSISPSKRKSKKIKNCAPPTKKVELPAAVAKSNGKQFVRQRPKLLQLNKNNNNNNDVCSSDEDKQTESSAAESRITYAIAMNNRMARDGSSNSGSSSTGGSGGSIVSRSEAAAVEPPTLSVGRYPRRVRRHVDYNEQLDTPDDDHFIFCGECERSYPGDCPIHENIIPIPDTPTTSFSIPNPSVASLPQGTVVRQSTIQHAGLGVFTSQSFQQGSTFGPYRGVRLRADVPKESFDTNYTWEIVKDGKVLYYVNGADVQHGNWMRYVNCSRVEEEQNLVAYQYHGEIFYRAYKDIRPGSELLVWYGPEYAAHLGIALDGTTITEGTTSVNGVAVFKCEWCDLCFCREERFLRHKKSCTKKPIEACDADDELHGKLKKPRCEVCGKRLPSHAHLEMHLRVHSGSKPFTCDVCGKGFTQQGNLTAHQRTHTKEKPFKCTECGKCFNCKGNLTSHMLIHTGELPFICEVCGYKCRQASNLRRHMRVHTGETLFKCDVCEYQCTQASNLKRHMRTHNCEKPYKCEVCGHRFTRSDNLKKHMKNKHSNE